LPIVALFLKLATLKRALPDAAELSR